ncbi:MAG: hypothetical protein HOJ62_02710 [Planctomycetaceae bacterium]|jgi:hypothetical protein|nr:hypothetical protein [Planctomycetaceae bacterium]
MFLRFTGIILIAFSCISPSVKAQDEPTQEEVQEFFLNILSQCQQNKEMEGAWVYSWEPDADGTTWVAKIIVDSENIEKQKAAFDKLFRNAPGNLKTAVDPKEVPIDLTSLLNSAQKELQAQLFDAGTIIEHISYGAQFPLEEITTFSDYELLLKTLSDVNIEFGGRLRSITQIPAADAILEKKIDQINTTIQTAVPELSFNPKSLFEEVSGSAGIKELTDAINLKTQQSRVLASALYEVFAVKDKQGNELRYEMYLYYDADNQAKQQEEFIQILKAIEVGGSFPPVRVVSTQSLPFGQLARQVNFEIQGHPFLVGCIIRGINFSFEGYLNDPASDLPYLVIANLQGDCQNESQIPVLTELLESVFARNDTWASFQERFVSIAVNSGEISARSWSSSEITRAYTTAIVSLRSALRNLEHAEQYTRCKQLNSAEQARANASKLFIESELAFIEATVASPESLDLRYLRILCLLAADRRDEARKHMHMLINRRPTLHEYAISCRALELFQGDLRLELIALERDVLLTHVYTHLGTPKQ